ncbi:MAG: PQQ-binding-like beta-propeller repeat protein [Paracoccaceae bacterium]|jgi:outer membrane protein assembly factor BamB|nr:PQQ-binding-like beta-propeller repeat protein [Paracoccaceae bacterium]
MTFKLTKAVLSLAAMLALSACGVLQGDRDILQGEREPIRSDEGYAGVIPAEIAGSADLRLPRARSNTDWTHPGGNIEHAPVHAALPDALGLAWATDIGEGNGRRHRVTAEPVADRGRIFAMDSIGVVSALNAEGTVLWQTSLGNAAEQADASGGGLAVDGNTLYAASGQGSLYALDVETGDIRWEQALDAAGVAAPTVAGSIVYIVGGDSRAWAIDAGTGRINWTISGAPSEQSFVGGASPAIGRTLAIFPFSNGDVQAVFRRGGFNRWNVNVGGRREGFAVSGISEITAGPVLDSGRVYVGNASGRIVALDSTTGERFWTAQQGTSGEIVPVGRNDLFTISDQNQLMRLSARSGAVIWSRQLPYFLNDNERRRSEIIAHYGPILAGGRLIVASSDGVLRQFSVIDGSELGTVAIPDGAASNPIVVNGTLYVVTGKGQLAAFR